MLCREQVARFVERTAAIHALGAELVLVGSGNRYFASVFAEDYGVATPILVDPELVTYKALELKASAGATFSLGTAKAGKRAWGRGFRQGKTQGAPFQQGGVFIILPDGSVPFTHVSAFAGDHPDEDEVIEALRQALP